MYSILIVDDERLIRNGIRDLLPWEELEIEGVFTAENAEEASDILEKNHIDVLLTDICMPKTTGLEMIGTLESKGDFLRTIVLTGYNDFEYAQQCCRMKVHDFLLKPICEDELADAIREQIAILKTLYVDDQKKRVVNRVIEMDNSLRLERSIRGLAHSNYSLAEISDILQEYGYNTLRQVQVVLVLPYLQDEQFHKDENELLLLSIKTIFSELVDAQHLGITFSDDEKQLGIVFFTNPELPSPYSQMELIISRLSNDLSITPKVLMGSVVNDFSQLNISYNDAIYLLRKKAENPLDTILQLPSIEEKMGNFYLELSNIKMHLQKNILDEKELQKGLQLLNLLFEEYALSLPFLRQCCYEVVSTAYYAYLVQNGDTPNNRLDSFFISLQTSTLENTFTISKSFLVKLLVVDQEKSNNIVQDAKKYIKDNLSQTLTVSSIASQLFINPNYFSRLFKKESGEGCNEYIARKRIEKAMILIETTNLKTGQIAEEVGYKDKNYFSLAFKKISGISPTVYRTNVRESHLISG